MYSVKAWNTISQDRVLPKKFTKRKYCFESITVLINTLICLNTMSIKQNKCFIKFKTDNIKKMKILLELELIKEFGDWHCHSPSSYFAPHLEYYLSHRQLCCHLNKTRNNVCDGIAVYYPDVLGQVGIRMSQPVSYKLYSLSSLSRTYKWLLHAILDSTS